MQKDPSIYRNAMKAGYRNEEMMSIGVISKDIIDQAFCKPSLATLAFSILLWLTFAMA